MVNESTDHYIGKISDGTKQEREEERREYDGVMDVVCNRVADNPATNEQVECKVVNPSSEQCGVVLERGANAGKRIEIKGDVLHPLCEEDYVSNPKDACTAHRCHNAGNQTLPRKHR